MIVGFNTDIKHRGRVYHCQTEDKGRSNPLVETLLYSGGQILDSFQTRYEDIAASADFDEKHVVRLMEDQHRRVISLIKGDKYLTEEERANAAKEAAAKERAIGAARGDERPLDELIRNWIENEMEHEEVELILATDSEFVAGCEVELRLKAAKNVSRGVVAGAKVSVKLISTVAEPTVLFRGVTDRMGECLARIQLPGLATGNAAVIIRADSDLGSTELRQLVKRAS